MHLKSLAKQAQHSYVWKCNSEDDTVSIVKYHLRMAVVKQNKNKSSAMHNGLMVKHMASISQFSKHPVVDK